MAFSGSVPVRICKQSGGESHLVIVVLKVRVLALQLDHLQPGDPLLLLGRHQVAVRIPALSLSTRARGSYKRATPWTRSSLTEAFRPPWECTLFLIEEAFVLGVELGDRTRVPVVHMCYMSAWTQQTVKSRSKPPHSNH